MSCKYKGVKRPAESSSDSNEALPAVYVVVDLTSEEEHQHSNGIGKSSLDVETVGSVPDRSTCRDSPYQHEAGCSSAPEKVSIADYIVLSDSNTPPGKSEIKSEEDSDDVCESDFSDTSTIPVEEPSNTSDLDDQLNKSFNSLEVTGHHTVKCESPQSNQDKPNTLRDISPSNVIDPFLLPKTEPAELNDSTVNTDKIQQPEKIKDAASTMLNIEDAPSTMLNIEDAPSTVLKIEDDASPVLNTKDAPTTVLEIEDAPSTVLQQEHANNISTEEIPQDKSNLNWTPPSEYYTAPPKLFVWNKKTQNVGDDFDISPILVKPKAHKKVRFETSTPSPPKSIPVKAKPKKPSPNVAHHDPNWAKNISKKTNSHVNFTDLESKLKQVVHQLKSVPETKEQQSVESPHQSNASNVQQVLPIVKRLYSAVVASTSKRNSPKLNENKPKSPQTQTTPVVSQPNQSQQTNVARTNTPAQPQNVPLQSNGNVNNMRPFNPRPSTSNWSPHQHRRGYISQQHPYNPAYNQPMNPVYNQRTPTITNTIYNPQQMIPFINGNPSFQEIIFSHYNQQLQNLNYWNYNRPVQPQISFQNIPIYNPQFQNSFNPNFANLNMQYQTIFPGPNYGFYQQSQQVFAQPSFSGYQPLMTTPNLQPHPDNNFLRPEIQYRGQFGFPNPPNETWMSPEAFFSQFKSGNQGSSAANNVAMQNVAGFNGQPNERPQENQNSEEIERPRCAMNELDYGLHHEQMGFVRKEQQSFQRNEPEMMVPLLDPISVPGLISVPLFEDDPSFREQADIAASILASMSISPKVSETNSYIKSDPYKYFH